MLEYRITTFTRSGYDTSNWMAWISKFFHYHFLVNNKALIILYIIKPVIEYNNIFAGTDKKKIFDIDTFIINSVICIIDRVIIIISKI